MAASSSPRRRTSSPRAGSRVEAHPAARMQRLLTSAIGVPLVLAAVFLLKGWWFFAFIALVVEGAVWEFAVILRVRAPRAPLRLLLLLAPLAAWGLSFALTDPIETQA